MIPTHNTYSGAVNIPDALIVHPLGTMESDPLYKEAKAGNALAAGNLVKKYLTQKTLDALNGIDNPVIVGVASVESSGKNKIPTLAASAIASSLNAEQSGEILQTNTPKRTGLDGLDRLFARPEFVGKVEPGRNYVLVDDTITQGGTFAALVAHIEQGGGKVAAVVALTGKQYSSKITLSAETLSRLREKFGDIENEFRTATGHGFDSLTESEARYLANYKPVERIRTRILAEGNPSGHSTGEKDVQGMAANDVESQNQGDDVLFSIAASPPSNTPPTI
jgi:adenine/guanine phosphoribosyltransferase-like PRPP-binding protein